MQRNPDTILALDPGLRELGYAIVSGRRLLASGVVALKYRPTRRRLPEAHESLGHLIRGYRPGALVLEQIPRRPLEETGGLPALGRLIRRLATRYRLRLATYSVRSVRRTVVGNGWAGKQATAEAIVKRFPELRVQLTQDRQWKVKHWQNMFDAVALALHHQALTNPPSRSRISG